MNTFLTNKNFRQLLINQWISGFGDIVFYLALMNYVSAYFFAPLAITGRARQYGLHTDSSHRFERGVDFELPRKAMEKATALLYFNHLFISN